MTTAAERETTITWSDADDGVATVWTAQRAMVTRLRRIRGAERQEVHRTPSGAWAGETWQVPVAAVLPRNPRVLSEAERARRALNLRSLMGDFERSGPSTGGHGSTVSETSGP